MALAAIVIIDVFLNVFEGGAGVVILVTFRKKGSVG